MTTDGTILDQPRPPPDEPQLIEERVVDLADLPPCIIGEMWAMEATNPSGTQISMVACREEIDAILAGLPYEEDGRTVTVAVQPMVFIRCAPTGR